METETTTAALTALLEALRADATAATARVRGSRAGTDAMRNHGQALAYTDAADRLAAIVQGA